jgi:predicted nuclease of predicted toxin-antitoxin system
VRFLVDNALSPIVAEVLGASEHDVLHVRQLDMQRADDEVIFTFAAEDRRIVISVDLDFGTLLALGHGTEPLAILLRRVAHWSPEQQAVLILANLAQLSASLESGCCAVIEPARVRVHALPIGGADRADAE